MTHPSHDSRSYFATDHSPFVAPEYLLDCKFHIEKDIRALRSEVLCYRDQLRAAIDCSGEDIPIPYEALLGEDLSSAEDTVDISYHMADLDTEAMNLGDERRQLRSLYAKESVARLEIEIARERNLIEETRVAVDQGQSGISAAKAKRVALLSTPLREEVDVAVSRTTELEGLLKELKESEADLTAEHHRLLNNRVHIETDIGTAAHNLKVIRHLKKQRKTEIRRLGMMQAIQLQALKDALCDGNDATPPHSPVKPPESARSSPRRIRTAEIPPDRIEFKISHEVIHLE
jgi:hypothetical protein